jgi:hypothetical protein
MTSGHPAADPELRADCGRCAGLCCVLPAFARSADFAIDKPAGRPCPNLGDGFRCRIHAQLRERGFPGCSTYDCFGAGQKVVQLSFAGGDWRTAGLADAFAVVRQLQELLWYLTEALTLPAARPLRGELAGARDDTDRLSRGTPAALAALDLAAHHRRVATLLRRASELARAGRRGRDLAGADLSGADLRAADLRGAALRGTHLIGADLTGADLTTADLIGADLRGARLHGADLTGALFVTRPQIAAAHGDAATTVPAALSRPASWS